MNVDFKKTLETAYNKRIFSLLGHGVSIEEHLAYLTGEERRLIYFLVNHGYAHQNENGFSLTAKGKNFSLENCPDELEDDMCISLHSIYEHMEKGAAQVPQGANCKIVFRHSVRGKIESGVGRDVKLTDEGIELARSFGRNLDYEIGFFATSSCERNIQTCNEILAGNGVSRDLIIASDELEGPQTRDKELSDMVFEQMNFQTDEVINKLVTDGLLGFNSIEVAGGIMLDFVFANGNKRNTVDLFCTHDFQMAILYAYLFDFTASKDELKENKWPMMLEGMIFWGTRKHFWCSWRNEIREFNCK